MSVLVVGGGVAGLAAAHALTRAGVPVTLVEASARLGGKVGTDRVDGFLVERGPDSFFAQPANAVELSRTLGLGAALLPPSPPSIVYAWDRGRLVPLPSGLALGYPRALGPLVTTPLLAWRAKARAALEVAVAPGRGDEDEAVGAFLRRRFGDAVVEHLAGPLVEGVYGTDVDELSLLAILPRLRDVERRKGSVLRASLFARAPRGAMDVLTLGEGLGSLVDALAATLGSRDVRLGTSVVSLGRAGAGYAARISDGSLVGADAVVVATPAPAAARILEPLAPGVAAGLAAIAHGSTAAVSLAYEADRIGRAAPGHGFLVAERALAIDACTFSSAKWAGRAPDGAVLLRATVRDPRLIAADDDAIVDAVHADLARVLGIAVRPILARVARYQDVMPRYVVGHLDRVAAIDAALADHPGLALAGASYRGVGVPACVAQGQAAAARVRSRLAVAAA